MITLVEHLRQRAVAMPDHLATIANQRGRWVPTTVRELVNVVSALAVGLESDGLVAGDRVAIVLGNVPMWLVADLAVQAAGGVSVAVPPPSDDEALAASLQAVDPTIVLVNDVVTVDRIVGLIAANRLDPIGRILHLGRGTSNTDGLDDVIARGETVLAGRPSAFDELAGRIDPVAAATITFSAGSGGHERPVVHSAASHFANAGSVATSFGLVYHDVTVTSLEPSHPVERSATLYPALFAGSVLAYPEAASTVMTSSLEIRPTFAHVSVDRLRAAAASVQGRLRRNRGLKRALAAWWRRSALERVRNGRPPSRLATRLVGRPALGSIGWDNLRLVLVAGDNVSADVLETMAALGLKVYNAYAVTEAGIVAVGRPGEGRGLPTIDGVAVSELDSQLVITSDGMGLSYGDGTPLPDTAGGGLLSGDVGRVRDTTVVVDGPVTSRVAFDGTSTVLLADVERRLRDSPYVTASVVRVDDAGLHADIQIDGDAVGEWASQRSLIFTTFSSLAELDEVESLIADEVARLAPDVVHHDLLRSPLQQGRDITRTGRSIYGRLRPGGTSRASTEHDESTAAVE